jgi:anti-anti-sigma factor
MFKTRIPVFLHPRGVKAKFGIFLKFPLLYKEQPAGLAKNYTLQPNIMNVKIDTKERFTVITPEELRLSVNMTEEFNQLLLGYLQKDIPHVILKMEAVQTVDEAMAENIANIQQQFYEKGCSFVICNLQKDVAQLLEQKELLEFMNVTPSESEAWDILQMEEIERELLGDE